MSPAARADRASRPTRAPRVEPPRWDFADRLRKIRKDVVRVEQGPFAEMIGVGRPAYATYEAGRARPRNIETFALAVEYVTGVPKEWLLWGDPGVDDARPAPLPAPVLPGPPHAGDAGDGHAAAGEQPGGGESRPAAASTDAETQDTDPDHQVRAERSADVTTRASCANAGQETAPRPPLTLVPPLEPAARPAGPAGPVAGATPYSSVRMDAA